MSIRTIQQSFMAMFFALFATCCQAAEPSTVFVDSFKPVRLGNFDVYDYSNLWTRFPITEACQLAESADAMPDPQKFVVGDWYDVTSERHGVKEQTNGMLVKVTDIGSCWAWYIATQSTSARVFQY
jgi:hypothetical protein